MPVVGSAATAIVFVKYFLQVPNLPGCSSGTYDVIWNFFIRDVESQSNVFLCPVHIRRPYVELIKVYLSFGQILNDRVELRNKFHNTVK